MSNRSGSHVIDEALSKFFAPVTNIEECVDTICELVGVQPGNAIAHQSRFGNLIQIANKAVIKVFDPVVRPIAYLKFASHIASTFDSVASARTSQTLAIAGIDLICSNNLGNIIVMEYVSGEQPYSRTRATELDLSADDIISMASIMSQYHEFARCIDVPQHPALIHMHPSYGIVHDDFGPFVSYYTSLRKVSDVEKLLSEIERLVEPYVLELKGVLSKSDEIPLHNDLIPRNFAFEETGEICGVFDFDLCNVGHPVFDLAWTVDYLGYPRLLLGEAGCPRTRLMHEFVNAYNSASERPIEIEVVSAAIPLVRLGYSLSCANYFSYLGHFDSALAEVRWLAEFLRYYGDHKLI